MNNSFNFLGLAKRANAVCIGQDNVLRTLSNKREMYVLVSNDVSPALLRKIQAKTLKSNVTIVQTNLSRYEIGSLLGIHSSSVLSIEKNNAFAEKIKRIESL